MSWKQIKTREGAKGYIGRNTRGIAAIYTPQEHLSMGGTGCEDMDPYKPLGVQEKEITAEEADYLRRVLGFYNIQMTGKYFGLDVLKGPYRISLEPLDENGNTIRDPRPIDADDYRYSDDFPNRR